MIDEHPSQSRQPHDQLCDMVTICATSLRLHKMRRGSLAELVPVDLAPHALSRSLRVESRPAAVNMATRSEQRQCGGHGRMGRHHGVLGQFVNLVKLHAKVVSDKFLRIPL